MKKFFAVVLALALVFSLASVAFADTEVISPEHGNTDVSSDPTSPQTGYDFEYREHSAAGRALRRRGAVCRQEGQRLS